MIIEGIPVKSKDTISNHRIIYYKVDDSQSEEIFEEGKKFAKFVLDKCPPEFYNGILEKMKEGNNASINE